MAKRANETNDEYNARRRAATIKLKKPPVFTMYPTPRIPIVKFKIDEPALLDLVNSINQGFAWDEVSVYV